MRKPHALAILVADLHLSLLKPACRDDKDWLEVQAGYLAQLGRAAVDHGGRSVLPILCGGDLFDRWNAPAELIHFALRHLPDKMICVAGQHDLPHHRLDLMKRSAYGVLKEVGKIVDLSEGGLKIFFDDFAVHGFGWNQPIEYTTPRSGRGGLQIALIHRYVWEGQNKYPDAPGAAQVAAYKKQLRGFHAAVFGDNHKGFLSRAGDCTVLNCGGFLRRKSDEIASRPGLGVLYSDGTIKRHWLNTSADKFVISTKDPTTPFNMQEFIDGLEQLGEHGLNFREAVENHLRGDKEMDPKVKQIMLGALEHE